MMIARLAKTALASAFLLAALCGPRKAKRCCGKTRDCCVTSRPNIPAAAQASPVAAQAAPPASPVATGSRAEPAREPAFASVLTDRPTERGPPAV